MVSTTPTDCRMPANSLLWSLRSDASSSRRLDEVLLAEAVMNPRWLAMVIDDKAYRTRGSLRLKRYRERGVSEFVRILVVGALSTRHCERKRSNPSLHLLRHGLLRRLRSSQ